MSYLLKKIFLSLTFNTCIFLLLIIGIQNSSNKSKVDFFFTETVNLPISFIFGTSFICGSLIGGLLNIDVINKKK
jgi:uncharacterized integral membrane protein